MLTIIAEIRVHEGQQHKTKVIHAFEKITPTVLAEQGCHGYELLVDADLNVNFQAKDDNVITMLEYWESIEHLNAHMQTAHMQAYQAEVKDDVIDVKIRILEKGLFVQ